MATITQALVLEHAVFGDVFVQIERVLTNSPSVQEVKLLAAVAEGLLRQHSETESHLAYSALDHALADQGALELLYQDHHEIDKHFLRIRRATDPVAALQLLHKALAATRDHFKREENFVFPVLEQTLRPDTQRALGHQWLEKQTVSRT
jgi:hemerythrin-like domain-containing protein